MKLVKYTLLIFCIFFHLYHAIAQNGCPIIGQNPNSAFPVCGSNVFEQGSVDTCSGRIFRVSQCNNRIIKYNDKNPYWYKFTCFKTGTLSFLITPNFLTDDYDWQLFDVTNHDSLEDVYTTPSLNVANNWSGEPGVTGTSIEGKSYFICGGLNNPTISAMPTIYERHNYLLMVSHFSDNQYGYKLSFNTGIDGGTAIISDTISPKVARVKLKCSGDRIGIKLNKQMLCRTLASNGSDFILSNNPKIDSVVGHGCNSGFDMDSVTIFLAAPYTSGIYSLITQADNAGKTIADICGTNIALADTFSFEKFDEQPTLMDSITTPLPCAPSQLELVFKRPLQCSTVLNDGSQFTISGPNAVSIASVTTNCDSNGLATKVYLNLSKPITIDGSYTIHLVKGTNFTTIVNECTMPTPLTTLSFKAINSASANFSYNTLIGCKQDTLNVKYVGTSNGSNNVTSWKWLFDNSIESQASDTSLIYTNFNPKTIKLLVSNGVCTDAVTQTLIPVNHAIKAGFIVSDTVCGNVSAAFQDTSVGIINHRNWRFGDGGGDSLKVHTVHSYPILDSLKNYLVSLVVVNQVGCVDSSSHLLAVKAVAPSRIDSVVNVYCQSSKVKLFFDKPLVCSSIASDGSNFTVYRGVDTVKVLFTYYTCNNNVANQITLFLAKSIKGEYKVLLHPDQNGKRILSECGIPTNDTVVLFKTLYSINADIESSIRLGCKQDTLFAIDTCHSATNWHWSFNNQHSESPSPAFIYNEFSPKILALFSSNEYCADSAKLQIIPLDHSIKADFVIPQDTICPTQLITFSDASKGIITHWNWTFGNGNTSVYQYPIAQSYPFDSDLKSYTISLIVKNIAGCVDTIYRTVVVKRGVMSIIDSIQSLPCAPSLVELHFSNKLLCNSIAHNGSNFSIKGPSNVLIDSVSINCMDGAVSKVQLALSSPINVTGNYLVNIKKASDNTQISNVCNILTPLGFSKNFIAYGSVSANFSTDIKYECKQATISYKNNGANAINHWLWTFNDSTSSFNCTKKDTIVTYTDLSDKIVRLVVSNLLCTDSGKVQTFKLNNYNDTVKAGFIIQKDDVGKIELTDFICPTEKAIYKDTSIGIINNWLWDFGNGQKSSSEMPSPQRYLATGRNAVNYPVKLIVKGNYCNDTAINYLKVIPNCYIDVPSAFSPNGDNVNDFLYPLNAYKAENLDFKVYDRYGQLVFETRDWTFKWDGKIKGAAPIVGTYIWTLSYTDHDTKEFISRRGTSVLIR